MLRGTPNSFALMGMTAFVMICVTMWALSSSRGTSAIAFTEGYLDSFKHVDVESPSNGHKVVKTAIPKISVPETRTNLADIQNSTLGFQKIFVLSMPSRSDKRDGLRLAAYLSGLDVEFVDGVDPSTIPEKAYPPFWKSTESPGALGCWRGHIDIYQRMLRDKIQTALIMEDDADWDIMIKAQMTEVARGTRALQRAPDSSRSPYGDSWDLLVTGHCGMWNKIGEDQEYYVIENDPTVPPMDRRPWWRKPNLTPPALSGNHSRVILSPYHYTCTGSYGISLSGAARAVNDQAVMGNAQSIDMGLGAICKKHIYGFSTCLGAYPMVTGIYKGIGAVSKDSDRTDRPQGDRKVAYSRYLTYPVRLNMQSLLSGDTNVRSQFGQKSLLPEIDSATLELPKGNLVFVQKKDYRYQKKEFPKSREKDAELEDAMYAPEQVVNEDTPEAATLAPKTKGHAEEASAEVVEAAKADDKESPIESPEDDMEAGA